MSPGKTQPAKAKNLFQFDQKLIERLQKLDSTRVVERPTKKLNGIEKIFSDLVWFRKPVTGQQALLVYSIQQQGRSLPVLQTCFSITRSAADNLIKTEKNSEVALRYNSVVEKTVD